MTDDVNRELIREIVERMVEELLDEALTRNAYVESLYNVLRGAVGEYYKARYADANGDPDPSLRRHWDEEVDEHFRYRFDILVKKRHRGKYDPEKAFVEAMEELEASLPAELAHSGRVFAKDFNLRANTLIDPPDSVTDEFKARCWNEFEARRRR